MLRSGRCSPASDRIARLSQGSGAGWPGQMSSFSPPRMTRSALRTRASSAPQIITSGCGAEGLAHSPPPTAGRAASARTRRRRGGCRRVPARPPPDRRGRGAPPGLRCRTRASGPADGFAEGEVAGRVVGQGRLRGGGERVEKVAEPERPAIARAGGSFVVGPGEEGGAGREGQRRAAQERGLQRAGPGEMGKAVGSRRWRADVSAAPQRFGLDRVAAHLGQPEEKTPRRGLHQRGAGGIVGLARPSGRAAPRPGATACGRG